jgi:hypothetical protein
MSTLVQGLFDFESGHINGYENWRREQEHRLQGIHHQGPIPVRRRVRLRLNNIHGDSEGVLPLLDQPLTIDNLDGLPHDIKQCVVFPDAQTTVSWA